VRGLGPLRPRDQRPLRVVLPPPPSQPVREREACARGVQRGAGERGRMAREGGGDCLPRDSPVRRRGAARARHLHRDVCGRARPRSVWLSTASIETMAEFKVSEAYRPTGDQPHAIESLSTSLGAADRYQTLLGATGTGKTATMAWII